MVVDNLHVRGTSRRPAEANAVLVVDTDAVLSDSVRSQLLEPIGWWGSQVIEHMGLVQLVEFTTCHLPQGLRTCMPRRLGISGIEDGPGPAGCKALNHQVI